MKIPPLSVSLRAPLALLACVLLTWTAQAQNVLQVNLASSAIAATGTNTPNAEIGLDNTTELTLQMNFRLESAVGVNSNVTATLQQTVDGINWVTWRTLALASNGTNTVSTVTNWSVGALPKVRIGPVISANTSAVASLEFWRGTKRVR